MENKSKKTSSATEQGMPPSAAEPDTLPSATDINTPSSVTEPDPSSSPWVEYLTKKTGIFAKNFLKDMKEGVVTLPDKTTGKPKRQKTNKINIPDEATRNHFAEELVSRPSRIDRLISLLQESTSYKGTIQDIVKDLAQICLKRLDIISFPEPPDSVTFSDAVSSWLEKTGKPLEKQDELNKFFLLISFGWRFQLLEHNTAFNLIASAVSSQPIRQPEQNQISKESAPTPLECILAVWSDMSLILKFMAYYESSKSSIDELNNQIQSQTKRITNLVEEQENLNNSIALLKEEIANTQRDKTVLETQVDELEKQVTDLHDGYRHQILQLRGRVRGMLQGQFLHWLQTSLDASRVEPPRVKVIQERLQDALNLIEKETQWLQSLD